MSTQRTAQQYQGTCSWAHFGLGLAKFLFLQNKSRHFQYQQEACKTVNAPKDVKNHAGRCTSRYIETTCHARRSVDVHPGDTLAVADSAHACTEQPTSPCMWILRGEHTSDLVCWSLVRLAFFSVMQTLL